MFYKPITDKFADGVYSAELTDDGYIVAKYDTMEIHLVSEIQFKENFREMKDAEILADKLYDENTQFVEIQDVYKEIIGEPINGDDDDEK